jgi:hypothetical protein
MVASAKSQRQRTGVVPRLCVLLAVQRADPAFDGRAHREAPADKLDTQTTRHCCQMLRLMLFTLGVMKAASQVALCAADPRLGGDCPQL